MCCTRHPCGTRTKAPSPCSTRAPVSLCPSVPLPLCLRVTFTMAGAGVPITSFGAHGEAQGGALAGNDTFIWSPLQFNNPRGSGSGKIGRYLRSAYSAQHWRVTLPVSAGVSACLYDSVPVSLPVSLSLCLSLYLCACLSVSLPVSLFHSIAVFLSLYLSASALYTNVVPSRYRRARSHHQWFCRRS